MAETTACRSHLHFYHLFIYGWCYSPDGATIFQGWFK